MNSGFKYKKDSVLVVTAEEYDKCHSAHPVFFSNNGATVFKLDKPGLFYFISGVAGHCERGQKMIIKVLEPETAPPLSSKANTTTESSHKSGAVEMAAISSPISVLFMVSFFWVLFIWMQCYFLVFLSSFFHRFDLVITEGTLDETEFVFHYVIVFILKVWSIIILFWWWFFKFFFFNVSFL